MFTGLIGLFTVPIYKFIGPRYHQWLAYYSYASRVQKFNSYIQQIGISAALMAVGAGLVYLSSRKKDIIKNVSSTLNREGPLMSSLVVKFNVLIGLCGVIAAALGLDTKLSIVKDNFIIGSVFKNVFNALDTTMEPELKREARSMHHDKRYEFWPCDKYYPDAIGSQLFHYTDGESLCDARDEKGNWKSPPCAHCGWQLVDHKLSKGSVDYPITNEDDIIHLSGTYSPHVMVTPSLMLVKAKEYFVRCKRLMVNCAPELFIVVCLASISFVIFMMYICGGDDAKRIYGFFFNRESKTDIDYDQDQQVGHWEDVVDKGMYRKWRKRMRTHNRMTKDILYNLTSDLKLDTRSAAWVRFENEFEDQLETVGDYGPVSTDAVERIYNGLMKKHFPSVPKPISLLSRKGELTKDELTRKSHLGSLTRDYNTDFASNTSTKPNLSSDTVGDRDKVKLVDIKHVFEEVEKVPLGETDYFWKLPLLTQVLTMIDDPLFIYNDEEVDAMSKEKLRIWVADRAKVIYGPKTLTEALELAETVREAKRPIGTRPPVFSNWGNPIPTNEPVAPPRLEECVTSPSVVHQMMDSKQRVCACGCAIESRHLKMCNGCSNTKKIIDAILSARHDKPGVKESEPVKSDSDISVKSTSQKKSRRRSKSPKRVPEAMIKGTSLTPTVSAPFVVPVLTVDGKELGYMTKVEIDRSFYLVFPKHFLSYGSLFVNYRNKVVQLSPEKIISHETADICLYNDPQMHDITKAYTCVKEVVSDIQLKVHVKRNEKWYASVTKTPWTPSATSGYEQKYHAQTTFGDCGSPVFDPNGCVVGIHVSGAPDGSGNTFVYLSTFIQGWLIARKAI